MESRKVSQNSSRCVSTSSFSTHFPSSGGRTTSPKPSFPPGSCWCCFLPARSVLVRRPRKWWESHLPARGRVLGGARSRKCPAALSRSGSVATAASLPEGVQGHVDANGERWPGSKNPCVKPSPLASIPAEGELEARVRCGVCTQTRLVKDR